MAVDEAMLDVAIDCANSADCRPTLRFYRWSTPTLSLGYFQAWRDRPIEVRELPIVRRITGGGAIVHATELTYSLVLPPDHWPHSELRQIVRDVHEAFIEAVRPFATVVVVADTIKQTGPEPFLCFHRRSPGDVVTSDSKILGSAQRSRRGALLQHGSLDCSVLQFAAADRNPLCCAVVDRVVLQLANRWPIAFHRGELNEAERLRAQQLQETKFADDSWTRRR